MNLPNVVDFAVPFFILAVAIEMVLWRMGGKGDFEMRDTGASLVMGFGSSITALLFGGFVVSAYEAVQQIAMFEVGYSWWAFVLCFFGEDLAYYGFHRLSHERRWFWASHMVHHTSQHYNLSTALRQTWTGRITFVFIFWLPLIALGFPPAMVLFFQGVSLVYQFWIHTEQIDRMGPFEWVFNTPSHHRVHHATNPRYLDANYAGVLIIWDRLFGSFVEEQADADPPRYGVITNIGTFNPIKIAFVEWIAIFRDIAQASSARDMWHYLWGPPGWSPDGSRRTTQTIKSAWKARETATNTEP